MLGVKDSEREEYPTVTSKSYGDERGDDECFGIRVSYRESGSPFLMKAAAYSDFGRVTQAESS